MIIMSNSEKIFKLMEKNNGYVTTREVVNNKIDKKFLSDMVKKEKLCASLEDIMDYLLTLKMNIIKLHQKVKMLFFL